MINKVASTSANLIDSKDFKNVAPNSGAVYADKGYCDKNDVFSKQNKRVRYQGIAKNQFTAFMKAITFNFKRLLVISASTSPPITT